MKKICTLAATALCVCYAAVAFAQNNLAAKYRADMLPLFVKYASIGSMSDNDAEWMTPGQEKMAAILVEDIKALFDRVSAKNRKTLFRGFFFFLRLVDVRDSNPVPLHFKKNMISS